MKTILVLTFLMGMFAVQQVAQAQSEKNEISRQRKILLDSLDSKAISVTELNNKYKYNPHIASFDSIRPVQQMVLKNGDTVRYLTTDDKKVA